MMILAMILATVFGLLLKTLFPAAAAAAAAPAPATPSVQKVA